MRKEKLRNGSLVDWFTRLILSSYQLAIDDWILKGRGNAVINAVAGAGKSTQIRRNVKMVRGSRLLCAFNATIAKENAEKINDFSIESKTLHSLGRSIITANYRLADKPSEYKYAELAKLSFDTKKDVNLMTKLFDLVRVSLIDALDINLINALIEHHSLDGVTDEMIQQLPLFKAYGLKLAERGIIDFTDMLWIPAALNLSPRKTYDWVFCDELQDLSPVQAELVARLLSKGGRFVGVGDPKQSIYGFAGADTNSFYALKKRFNAIELPLSITYRCPIEVVKLAKAIVPHIEARPDAPPGNVTWINESELPDFVKDGDLILCRLTAPLISQCIAMIIRKIPARVRGRDIGKNLTAIVDKIAKKNYGVFNLKVLIAWSDEEHEKLSKIDNNESAVQALNDKVDGLVAIWRAYADEPDYGRDAFIHDIEGLFSDIKTSVILSTIHKAKGLEEQRVFILKPSKLGGGVFKNQNAWQLEQERNLSYVAITRSMNELYFCFEEQDH